MTDRERNRAVVFTGAGAQPTQTSEGERTVTIKGHFAELGFSQTNTMHLSRDAAFALLWELFDALRR
ncbi:hypothetical protein ACWGA9_06305 [Streptomyces sp. NPDC054950]